MGANVKEERREGARGSEGEEDDVAGEEDDVAGAIYGVCGALVPSMEVPWRNI